MTNHISLTSSGLTYTAKRLEVDGKPVVTVLVTDNQPEDKFHYLINGTTFTFTPRTVTVTNTFTGAHTGIEKTFTLFTVEPGKRTGGADQLLDGGFHSVKAATAWLEDSEAVAVFVKDFTEEHMSRLSGVISASRHWGEDDVERMNIAASEVTGIININEKVQQSLVDKLITEYIQVASR